MNTEDPDHGSPYREQEPSDADRQRINAVCERSTAIAYRLAVRAVGPHDAQDLAQNVAFKAWKQSVADPGFFDDLAKFDSWVATVARHEVVDFVDAEDAHDARQLDFAEAMEDLRWRARHPGVRAFAQARQDALDAALRQMPRRRREVFLAVREDGMTHEGAAQKFGIAKETVHRHVSQALEDLRGVLADFGEPDDDPLWQTPARRRRTDTNEEAPEHPGEGQEGDDD